MAFNEELAERIRKGLTRRNGIEEKKPFGGIGFLLNGNLLAGIWKDSLVVRLGPEESEQALKEPPRLPAGSCREYLHEADRMAVAPVRRAGLLASYES
jgi:hypothetical protein